MLARPKRVIESEITHAGQVIPFKIITSKRRTFSIAVYPNCEVVVKAPLRANINSLTGKVQNKADWILKHLQKFENQPAKKLHKYEEGEVFHYLGTQYKLKLVKALQPEVLLNDDEMIVKAKNISPSSVKTVLKFWYQERATELFTQRLDSHTAQLQYLKLPQYSKLIIKSMKSRWGSCARDRVITLNPNLIAAPLECVDYVIIHELCHLRELNHSPRYYKLLSQALPDWKYHKQRLNKTTGISVL